MVALGGPPALAVASERLFGDTPTLGVQFALQLIFCGLAAIVLFIGLGLERLPLQSMGLRKPSWSTLGVALLLALIVFVLLPLVMAPLLTMLGGAGIDEGIRRLAVLPGWYRLFVGATSGFVEETLYRGYSVERLIAMTGRRWLGATLAAVAFGAAHIPFWGLTYALAADLPAGAIFVVFYLWRRDLVANGLAHSAGLMVALFTAVPWAD